MKANLAADPIIEPHDWGLNPLTPHEIEAPYLDGCYNENSYVMDQGKSDLWRKVREDECGPEAFSRLTNQVDDRGDVNILGDLLRLGEATRPGWSNEGLQSDYRVCDHTRRVAKQKLLAIKCL